MIIHMVGNPILLQLSLFSKRESPECPGGYKDRLSVLRKECYHSAVYEKTILVS